MDRYSALYTIVDHNDKREKSLPEPGSAGLERCRKGRLGETVVAGLLESEGYTILDRNFRAGPGEIDLVARRGTVIVFVEVKNWYSLGVLDLEFAIGRDKRRRMIETSKIFLHLHRQYNEACIRYDVFLMRGGNVAGRYESAFAGVV